MSAHSKSTSAFICVDQRLIRSLRALRLCRESLYTGLSTSDRSAELMSIHEAIFLFTAALVAGVLNSVAGGDGFNALPTLVYTGITPINAKATNTAALWPGTVASTGAYRNVLSREDRNLVLPLVVTGAIGGLIGAIVLLKTPQQTFLRLIPW